MVVDGRVGLASVNERLIGRIVDLLVHVVIGIAITLPAQGDLDSTGFSWWAFSAAAAMFAWETAWVGISGASVGKHLAGTRVVSVDPNRPFSTGARWWFAALRATPRLLWGFPLGILFAVPIGTVSVILLATAPYRQTLADYLSQSRVVRRPVDPEPSPR